MKDLLFLLIFHQFVQIFYIRLLINGLYQAHFLFHIIHIDKLCFILYANLNLIGKERFATCSPLFLSPRCKAGASSFFTGECGAPYMAFPSPSPYLKERGYSMSYTYDQYHFETIQLHAGQEQPDGLPGHGETHYRRISQGTPRGGFGGLPTGN